MGNGELNIMWEWSIKQDGVKVCFGRASNKYDALKQLFHYSNQYSEEDFNKMTIQVKHYPFIAKERSGGATEIAYKFNGGIE